MEKKSKFKQTEIGMIPEDWEVKELQEVVTKLGDGLHGTPKYDDNGEYYFINGNNLANGKIKFNENTKKCTKEEFEKYKKELNNRTILVSINGTLGNIALYQGEKIILGKSVCYLNIKNEFSVLFIKYVLKNKKFQNYIHFNATGTTIKNVSLKQMKEFKFSIPKSFNEQRAIAKILSDLDAKIELLQKQNETLEKIGQEIFKHWFVDFEFPNEEGKPYKSSGGEMVYNEELGKKIPKGWRVSQIGKELKTVLGGTPSRVKKEYWTNGTIPWINSGKINEFRIIEPTEFITEEALQNSSTKLLPKGTVVVAITGATLGQVSRLEIDSCANQSVVGILENKSLKSSFILYLIKAIIKDIIKKQTGGAQQHINKNNINETYFIIPSKSILDKYYKVTGNILHKISINCFQIQTLQQIRDSLLPKLMTGKIRVPVEIER